MRIDVDVRTSGPSFDVRAERALREYVDEAPYEIAGEGVEIWLTVYRPQVQHPTPYYEYMLSREKVEYAESHVWDGGVIVYGPWLEGVGSRNHPVTRFKGYASMKKTTPILQGRAVAIAERLLRNRYLDKMQ